MALLANKNALELDHVYMEKEKEEEQSDEKSSSNNGYVMNHNSSSSSHSHSHSSPSSSNNSSGFKFQASNYDHQEHSQYSLINFKYDDDHHHMMHSNNGSNFLSFGLNDHSVSNQYSSSALDVNQQWNNPQMVDISSFKTATSSINIIINRNIHDQSTTSQGVAHHHHKRPHMDEHEKSLKKQCIAKTSTSASKKSKPNTKDPQSIAAKNRRERISERLKVLQELVPNGSKVDMVTMLEKAISYVQFLQLQVKVLATDEFWPAQGGKSPDISQVKEAIDAILSSQRNKNSIQ